MTVATATPFEGVVLRSGAPVAIPYWLTFFPLVSAVGLGIVAGWLLAKGRKGQAVAVLLVGGLLAFLLDALLFHYFGVFDLKNEIR
ncbi:MAG: hypothetical protein JWM80_2701 [Cyanobacteria bacterium RYN_339]|nr:hypothetical protein [Cyanobacteria bacterium RYN_339]